MKKIKDELQHIILGDEQAGRTNQLKKVQTFLRRHAETSSAAQNQEHVKNKEAAELINFARREKLFYEQTISENDFISSGAEQRVYRLNDTYVIKTNASIFYEYWLDYFNSLLIHNYYFPATAYKFMGFKIINDELFVVVQQEFVSTIDVTDLFTVKQFLTYNKFFNTRNNDYINKELGIILEDLHDENVLSKNSVLFFVDTVFYITPVFYSNE